VVRAPFVLSLSVLLLGVASCGGGGSKHQTALDDVGAAAPATGGGGKQSPVVGLDPTLSWQGYAEGSSELGAITLGSFRDPDGSKGIRVLLLAEVSFACEACKTESEMMTTEMASTWATQGVKVLQLVLDDPSGSEANVDSAKKWRAATGNTWAVVADPNFTFAHEGSNPMPQVLVIDPRNLSQATRVEGYDPPSLKAAVAAMAKANPLVSWRAFVRMSSRPDWRQCRSDKPERVLLLG
jgi:hypothetical protein